MAITTPHELFVHNLEDIYYTGKESLDAFSQLEAQTESEQIATAFREHRQETEAQLDRLERVFEILEAGPEAEKCQGVEGHLSEREEFVEENREGQLLDLHNLVAGQRTEHCEIAVVPVAGTLYYVIFDGIRSVTEGPAVLHVPGNDFSRCRDNRFSR